MSPMRILYMSDLHTELDPLRWRLRQALPTAHPRRGPDLAGIAPPDLIVLAGDIGDGVRAIAYADQLARYLRAPAVFVAGNHEFYHHDIARLLPAARAAAARTQGRVQLLENASARLTIAGRTLHILGCTLWTDYALEGEPRANMAYAGAHMNDHRFIRESGALFTPQQARDRHMASRNWLRLTLEHLEGQTTLVVTHHAPSAAGLGPRDGPIAPAYASNLIPALRPTAWIHGHTHHRHETLVEGVRLCAAPRGDEPDAGYRPGLLVL
jgi:predicted MPP superfamily phosphohydrolase